MIGTSGSRPAMPAQAKRQLRQEAGFGCCVCGYPFIQYHHIIPWSVEQHFRVEDMMALCSRHHELCTVGAIRQEEQRRHKNAPINLENGFAKGLLYVNSDKLVARFGNNLAESTPNLLVILGRPVVSLSLGEAGNLLVSAEIMDRQGATIARIIDNEWQFPPKGVWDFDCAPRRGTIRSEPRNISFEVGCRDDIVAISGRWRVQHCQIVVNDQYMEVDGYRFSNVHVKNCENLLEIGP